MENAHAHKYEYNVDLSSDTAPAHVIQMVGNDKRVLEIGPGPGSTTKLLKANNCRVTALEYDRESIKTAAPYCETIIQADLNLKDWPRLLDDSDPFDVVVAADVLEHLYDPWMTLRRMVPFIGAKGYLVISLPHVGHALVMSCLLNGDFEYKDRGLLDRTHIRFFGLKNMEALFAQADLKIIEARYVTQLPEETEYAASWSALPFITRKVLMSNAHARIYQVVVKAVPLDYRGDMVPLVPPKRTYKQNFAEIPASWKARIARRLSPELKRSIRKSFKIFGINL
jgi:2-polyprenyl-3-methyl-5-hydroxy-6-metoxy-1,4-benzoquinol methylase